MQIKVYPIILISTALFLAGCDLLHDRRETARVIATAGGLEVARYRANGFQLMAYQRLDSTGEQPLVIYIEGDGHAWHRRNHLADDPTPRYPLALKLAARDTRHLVVYLARPCQYIGTENEQHCQERYWSSHRYAPEVIKAYDSVIDSIKSKAHPSSIMLVGYSGGGTIAALVAARRVDIAMLVTIAGNLDLNSWTTYHRVTPLHASLDPADYGESLQKLRQIHFVGEDDRLVPPDVIRRYLEKIQDHGFTTLRVIENFDHHCCWTTIWPDLLCRQSGIPGNWCPVDPR